MEKGVFHPKFLYNLCFNLDSKGGNWTFTKHYRGDFGFACLLIHFIDDTVKCSWNELLLLKLLKALPTYQMLQYASIVLFFTLKDENCLTVAIELDSIMKNGQFSLMFDKLPNCNAKYRIAVFVEQRYPEKLSIIHWKQKRDARYRARVIAWMLCVKKTKIVEKGVDRKIAEYIWNGRWGKESMSCASLLPNTSHSL